MKGEITYLYAFDVASEIATERIREILSEKPSPFEIRLGKTIPKDIPLYRPLAIALPPQEYESSVGRVTLRPFVKIIDVGIVSIAIEIPFESASLGDLVPYHSLTLSDGRTLGRVAEEICLQVRESIRPALLRPVERMDSPEAYTVFCLASPADPTADTFQNWASAHRREIAALLTEELKSSDLSEAQIAEVTDHTLSYSIHDLVVIDWDAAFVIDRDEYYDDVIYVLELANLQLEEFQYIDRTLDVILDRAYDDLEQYYRRVIALPQKTLSSLRRMQMDLTKMSDEVTNIAKFSGDWYLARVYLACRDRFHIDRWRESIREKLQSLEHLYTLANTEVNNRRMALLEGIIVVLFILDVLMLLLLKR